MGEGVAVVEDHAQPRLLALVLLDHVGLEPAAPGDDRDENLRFSGPHRRGVRFEEGEELGVEDGAVLHHLGEPAEELALRERVEVGGVDPDAGRLVERDDQVLPLRVVDADLSADGRIDHRQEGRRDHEQRQAAVVRGGGEPGEVTDDPAADGDDGRLAVGCRIIERVVEVRGLEERLGRLAGGHDGERGAEPGGPQARFDGPAVRLGVAVGDDEGEGRARQAAAGERPDAGGVGGRQGDVVGPRAEVHADGVHGAVLSPGGTDGLPGCVR